MDANILFIFQQGTDTWNHYDSGTYNTTGSSALAGTRGRTTSAHLPASQSLTQSKNLKSMI